MVRPPASPSPKPSDLLLGLCCSLLLGTLPGRRLGGRSWSRSCSESPWLLHSSPVKTESAPSWGSGLPHRELCRTWPRAGLNQTKEGAQASGLTLSSRCWKPPRAWPHRLPSGPPGCCASKMTFTSCLCLCADLADAVSVQGENQAGRRPQCQVGAHVKPVPPACLLPKKLAWKAGPHQATSTPRFVEDSRPCLQLPSNCHCTPYLLALGSPEVGVLVGLGFPQG